MVLGLLLLLLLLLLPGQRNQHSDSLRAGRSGNQTPRGGENFPYPSRPAPKSTQPPLQWVPGLFSGGKAAGGGVNYPSSASADAKRRVDLYLYYPPLGLRGLLEDGFYLHYYYHHYRHHQLHCCYTMYLSVSHILMTSSEYFPKRSNLMIFVQKSPSVFCGKETELYTEFRSIFVFKYLNIGNILNAPVVLDWSC